MTIRHFYHLYLDGDAHWQKIAAEYAAALNAARFPIPPAVGLVGANRRAARRWCTNQGWTIAAEADTGYEQVTLTALQTQIPDMADDDLVLYTHAKGSWRNMAMEDQWRRAMIWHLIIGWHHCVNLLEDHDTVGCYWKPRQAHYAGNFWWARAQYLRTLPPVTGNNHAERGLAETWIGLRNPTIANLLPGTPPAGSEEPDSQLTNLLWPAQPPERHDHHQPGIAGLQGTSPLGTPAPPTSIPYGRAERM